MPSVTFHSSGGLAIYSHASPRLKILLISSCRYISWSKLWGRLNLWYSYQMHSAMVHSALIQITTKHWLRARPWFIKTEESTMRCNDYLHHDHCIFMRTSKRIETHPKSKKQQTHSSSASTLHRSAYQTPCTQVEQLHAIWPTASVTLNWIKSLNLTSN